ncbi:uncharacterized protein A1O9_12889 [Exophiala aquamarina CBS 119918]|uniref:Uncharacterized protein n=1 Tax=Exophiala aquamarina CBS 119918 TaxID=1182545 RepID=A0A072NT35_9EURO|nr:uncharacterized protein A1O9_12889 [Exophiala aquamarina CBS 119918]KEF51039.1 hypothetical protein A1O9_12889 [Exophiala aquamarina CBS 119918]
MSINEIFSTLIHGGYVVWSSESDRMNNIRDFIDKNKVKTAILTPTELKMLPTNDSHLHNVVLIGEAGTDHLI